MYIIYMCIYLITFDRFLRLYEQFLLKFEDGSHPDVTVVLNRNDAQRIKAGGYKKNDVCMSLNLIYSLYMHTLYMLHFDRQQFPINT